MEGIPSIYEAEGREYLVLRRRPGLTRAAEEPVRGAYVAFALPLTAKAIRNPEQFR